MGFLSDLRVPVFSAGGMPETSPEEWQLSVFGLVEEQLAFPLAAIRSWPQSEVDARMTSVSGFSFRARWQGILWRDFLPVVKVQPRATHATFISQGGGYTTTVSLEDLDQPRVLLVLA